jgi:hypothetical protein
MRAIGQPHDHTKRRATASPVRQWFISCAMTARSWSGSSISIIPVVITMWRMWVQAPGFAVSEMTKRGNVLSFIAEPTA